MNGARRTSFVRLAYSLLCGLFLTSAAGYAQAAEIISASYSQPTTRYAHGVLGDDVEYGAIDVEMSDGSSLSLVLPETRVFEDLQPRLFDLDSDGDNEIIAVESSMIRGARLSVYDENGLVAATPYIGRSNRWLAPVGAADLDGDGYIEIAYIDRPHLAKTLRVWRFADGVLTEVASEAGYTNHKIGWDFIPGGIRNCGDEAEMIVASGNWSRIVSVSLSQDLLTAEKVGPYAGHESLNAALNCP